MAYRTIAVHVDASEHAPARVALAAGMAAAMGSHLTGVAAVGVSRYAQSSYDSPAWKQPLLDLRQLARQGLAAFDGVAAACGVQQRTLALEDDDAAGALMTHSRSADLLIVSQHDPLEVLPTGRDDLPPLLLLNSGRPLLVTPRGMPAAAPTISHVLLAWDGSRHAARAIVDALPLLHGARQVTLLMLNATNVACDHGAMPGSDMALFLARHGVAADMVDGFTGELLGAALLQWAADPHCDLLVMGGYGHSRAREVLLGGATQTVLRDATMPVLISH